MNEETDPTRISLILPGTKRDEDPRDIRLQGIAIHGNTRFDTRMISQIAGNLWQGGCEDGLKLPSFFKAVVSLYKWERYDFDPEQVAYHEVTMYDSNDRPDYGQIKSLAELVSRLMDEGPVLVHCQAGLNRSSLVVAATLMERGMSALDAIALIRSKRSPACLCNTTFEQFLHSYGSTA